MLSHGLRAALAGQQEADPYFKNTVLLLHGDGTNGAQNNTFVDSSSNNFTVTRNGNTTQGTFTPFSVAETAWSNYFDGTGDYLTVAANTVFSFGTGDFTIECWVNPSTTNNDVLLCTSNNVGGNGVLLSLDATTLTPYFFSYVTAGRVITSSTGMSVGTWNHIALVRASGTATLYLNGVSVGSAAHTSSYTSTQPTGIGATGDGVEPFTGYLSNVRIVKGTAVYTGAFTPSTSPLTAIANTSLLVCQSNRIKDNSSNAFTITRNGDVSVQAFSPFAPSAAYSTAANGGSLYFDGTGDYLSLPASANLQLAYNGTWTIEFFAYPTVDITPTLWTGGDGTELHLTHSTRSYPMYGPPTFNSSGDISRGSSTISMNKNTWNHVAVVNNGSTHKIYVNGVEGASIPAIPEYTYVGYIAYSLAPGGSTFPGYLSNFRVVKGTTVYTGAFTPPTAPLTAITNTQLLLLGTNAGIYDSAAKNDLETVGNAQISTSSPKYGTGSILFDGTGDYLQIPANPNFAFGTGDFTIECWVKTSAIGADTFYRRIYMTDGPTGNASGNLQLALVPTTGYLDVYTNGTDLDQIGNIAINTGAWVHIAVTRSGTTLRQFVNGVQSGSSTYSTSVTANSGSPRPRIGSYDGTNGDWDGYIDDLRITKGVARYTANFTPPTKAFPDR